MGSFRDELFVTILGDVYGITLGIGVRIELGSLDRYFYGCNDGKFEGLLLGESMGSNGGKVLVSDEVIKIGLYYFGLICTILGNFYGITLGIDVVSELGYLDGSFDGSNLS